jgi:hypothetical protein
MQEGGASGQRDTRLPAGGNGDLQHPGKQAAPVLLKPVDIIPQEEADDGNGQAIIDLENSSLFIKFLSSHFAYHPNL